MEIRLPSHVIDVVLDVTLVFALIAGLIFTVRAKAPQFTGWSHAWAGLRSRAEGGRADGVGLILASMTLAAAPSLVGLSTAVGLGGTGAIAWCLLFGFIVAPLRVAEVYFARTAPPGAASDTPPRSFVDHLARGHQSKPLAWLMLGLIVLFIGGYAGIGSANALGELGADLFPSNARTFALAMGVLAALIALAPLHKVGPALAWIGVTAWIVVLGVGVLACMSAPSIAISSIGRAISDAFNGAPDVGAFSGALAGEIMSAALRHIMLAYVLPVGVLGALQSDATGASTQKIAMSAMFAPVMHTLTALIVGAGLVATGAFHGEREVRVPFSEITVYGSSFETASQRLEEDRPRGGAMRIREGILRDNTAFLATERSIIESPRFEYWGQPADIALRLDHGKPVAMMRYQGGALDELPLSSAKHLIVIGQGAPRGAGLLTVASSRPPGGASASRALFGALFVLSVLALAFWGQALRQNASSVLPAPAAMIAGVVPAAACVFSAWFSPAGIADITLVGSAVTACIIFATMTVKVRQLSFR